MGTDDIRQAIIKVAETLLGTPYKFGYQLPNLDVEKPEFLDCSEYTRLCYHKAGLYLPDGSSVQYEYCGQTDSPLPGDLGFFKETRVENDAKRPVGTVYHVGIFFDNIRVIEARGTPYGKVIFRPVSAWREFCNFSGWRKYPTL